jgi:hypothetical protein
MRYALIVYFALIPLGLFGQPGMRSLDELIDTKDSAWKLILEWRGAASNQVEILPRDESRAREALFQTQVTTRSPMGAIIYESGGILVDGGWIRILGSGSARFLRTLPSWNKGKTFQEYGMTPGYVLIADDAIGGFFAINGGAIDKENLGTIYYLSPDNLEWESLDLTYTRFIQFCFSGGLDRFYKGLRWKQWKRDVAKLSPDQAFSIYPFLFTKEGKDIEKDSKRGVPVEEVWGVQMSFRKQLGIK